MPGNNTQRSSSLQHRQRIAHRLPFLDEDAFLKPDHGRKDWLAPILSYGHDSWVGSMVIFCPSVSPPPPLLALWAENSLLPFYWIYIGTYVAVVFLIADVYFSTREGFSQGERKKPVEVNRRNLRMPFFLATDRIPLFAPMVRSSLLYSDLPFLLFAGGRLPHSVFGNKARWPGCQNFLQAPHHSQIHLSEATLPHWCRGQICGPRTAKRLPGHQYHGYCFLLKSAGCMFE